MDVRAMLQFFFISVGIFSVAWLPALPSLSMLFGCALAGGSILALLRQWLPTTLIIILSVLLVGFSYGVISGHLLLRQQLPETLDRQEFSLTGRVTELPAVGDDSVRFYLRVTSVHESDQFWLVGKRIRLSWYGHVVPESGQQWQLQVRLRRPRGFVNPGGFDYHGWLLREHISATGYVRKSDWNQLLTTENQLLEIALIDRYRWQLREAIGGLPLSEKSRGLLVALTIGDGSLLSSELWDQFVRSGVVHLLVISGLHIGFSGLLGFWLGCGLARCLSLLKTGMVARYWGSLCSILLSSGYAVLSGFGLPAQRALVMIVVVNLALLLGRNIQRGAGFSLALLVVAVVDPLAVTSAGFWLSFGAVAVLLWLLPPARGRWATLKQFVSAQWLLFVALLGLLMLWQLPQSLLSPLVNLVAIPWISFLVVPLCLLAALIYPISEVLAEWFWRLAGWQLEEFSQIILRLPDWTLPDWTLTPLQMIGLLLAIVLLLLPKGVPGRYLSLVLLVALSLPKELTQELGNQRNPLTVTVLDVGQGLAVVVQTREHTLVYDAGPLYSERFNAGSGVITPYLKQSGDDRIDTLLVSHGDSDHAGGVMGLLKHYQPDQIIWGEPLDLPSKITGVSEAKTEYCRRGMAWNWDGVAFRILSPSDGQQFALKSSNNRSCVLLISYREQHILLPGDIERTAERELLGEKLPVMTLLVAPHHGSKTSSSKRFLAAIQPQHVVFSAGYRHHFGHPHAEVVTRYQSLGTKQWNTATSGAVIFSWDEQGLLQVSEARHRWRRYWF